MLITEIFNAPVSWKVREHRPDYFDAKFKVDKIEYIFRASAYLNNGEEIGKLTEWDIEFYADLGIPRVNKYGILQFGNEIPVFATVLDILKHFIKEYKPLIITFSAEEPSRKKLYLRMVKTLLPNWEVEQTTHRRLTITNPSLSNVMV